MNLADNSVQKQNSSCPTRQTEQLTLCNVTNVIWQIQCY